MQSGQPNSLATRSELYDNTLNFFERNLVASSIVEHGRPWALMGGNGPGVLDESAVIEIDGDTSSSKSVAANFVGLADALDRHLIMRSASWRE
jgi:hypothetical protein